MERWIFLALALVLLAVAATIAVTLVPASAIKRRMKDGLSRAARGKLVLTYDDGPGPLLTPPLLKLLADHGAKASFYLVGFRAERFPHVNDAIAAAGHEIGNHTHWHRNAWRTLPWLAVRDLQQGYKTLGRWIRSDAPFRPPFGKMTTWTHRATKRRGADMCFWTHDSGDTWPTLPDPQSIADQVAHDGGGVILIHSHDRGEDRQKYVLAVTECLLRTASERSWRVCTMSEILHASNADQARSHAIDSAIPCEGAA